MSMFVARVPRALGVLAVAGVLATLLHTPSAPRATPAIAAQAELATSFVGKVGASGALVGVVTNGDQIAVYICDSQNYGEWFRAGTSDAVNGVISAVTARGLQVSIPVDSFTSSAIELGITPKGSVTFGEGNTVEFSTATAVGNAGIWRAEIERDGVSVSARWVVDNDGAVAGALDISELNSVGQRQLRLRGLQSDVLDIRNAQANLPEFGVVDVSRVSTDIFFINR